MPQQISFHLFWIAAMLAVGCAKHSDRAHAPPPKVTVFTAASTRDVMQQLTERFQRDRKVSFSLSPGPSSGLARQIGEGAEVDLFLSADEAAADFLADRGLVARRRTLLTNRLVVIVPAESQLEIASLADLESPQIKHLAVAEAKVPAGEYARQSLKKAGLLEKLSKRFVGGVDVRHALTLVARAEAQAGFVYSTDTVGNSRVKVAYDVPAGMHRPIEYPLVLLKPGEKKPLAIEFYEFLGSPAAAEIFRAAKFGLAP